MPWFRPRDLLDQTFEVGIILKGLDGLLEVIGGLLLLVVSPATIDRLVTSLTQHELSEGHCCIERSPHATASTSPLKYDRSWARSSVSALSWRPSMRESLHVGGFASTFRLNATVPPGAGVACPDPC